MLATVALAAGDPAAAAASRSEPTAIEALCCFHLTKAGGCSQQDSCRFRHAADDGVSGCNFGPTCRNGHKMRVLPQSLEAQQRFWIQFNANGVRVGVRPSDRDATELRAQLEPWPTAVLRRRLHCDFGLPEEAVATLGRAETMQGLLQRYGGPDPAFARRTVRVNGTPVRPELLQAIEAELRAWAAAHQHNDRPSISASNYSILRSPAEFSQKDSQLAKRAAEKLKEHARLWELAFTALNEVDPVYAEQFSALAITRNFKGSPHIDKQNTGPFYGLSLGSFPEGQGGVCVEANAFLVAHVNTRNRLGKVDGRFPHWVAPYDEGSERFSLIFYQTNGGYLPPTTAFFGTPILEEAAAAASTLFHEGTCRVAEAVASSSLMNDLN